MVLGFKKRCNPLTDVNADADQVLAALRQQRFGCAKQEFCDAGLPGIGALIDEDRDGFKFLRCIVPGGPLDQTGVARVHDRVHRINGIEVKAVPLGMIKQLIIGSEKDIVDMVISRPSNEMSQRRASWAGAAPPASEMMQAVYEMDLRPRANSSKDPQTGISQVSEGEPSSTEHVGAGSSTVSPVSDASTTHSTDGQGDERVEMEVHIVRACVVEPGPDVLDNVIYIKGYGAYIRGSMKQHHKEERRWVAVRNGRLIVTKGKNAAISKVVNLSTASVSRVLTAPEPNGTESYWVAVKVQGAKTMHFGGPNKARITQLGDAMLAEHQVETSVADSAHDRPAVLYAPPAKVAEAPKLHTKDYAQLA